jgi:TatD DNase family protein
LQGVVQGLPSDRILIETDAPFLAPHPQRGRRNEPANVLWIARKIAELRNIEEETLINETTINAARLFCW